jgi:hypothetical protein
VSPGSTCLLPIISGPYLPGSRAPPLISCIKAHPVVGCDGNATVPAVGLTACSVAIKTMILRMPLTVLIARNLTSDNKDSFFRFI